MNIIFNKILGLKNENLLTEKLDMSLGKLCLGVFNNWSNNDNLKCASAYSSLFLLEEKFSLQLTPGEEAADCCFFPFLFLLYTQFLRLKFLFFSHLKNGLFILLENG